MSRTRSHITWSERIEHALEHDGFELWAQPLLDLRDGRTTSHELLLRVRSPDGGTVLPGRFLYVAERVGLIGEIDRTHGGAVAGPGGHHPHQPAHRAGLGLVGGGAAMAYGATRPTGDLDFIPARDRDNLRRLADAMRELGAFLRVGGLSDDEEAQAVQPSDLSGGRASARP